MPLPVTYTNELGVLTTSSNINAGSSIIICAEEDTVILPNGNFSVEKLGSCELAPIDPIDPIELPDVGIIPIGTGGGSTGGGGGGSISFGGQPQAQPRAVIPNQTKYGADR